MWMCGMGPAMMVLIGIVTLAVLAILVAGVIWLARSRLFGGRGVPGGNGEDALRRRYGAGEIDDDEFRRRLATLPGHPTEPGRPDMPDQKGPGRT